MAIQRHLGFQAQRVARAQAAGLDAELYAGVQDFVPQAGSFRRRDVDFVAIFAGVAGAGDAGRSAGDHRRRRTSNSGWRTRSAVGQFLQSGARVGALDGDLRITSLDSRTSASKRLCAHDVLEVLLLVGGVDAQEIVVVGDFVDQDVVDESAVFVEQAGVLDLAGFQPRWRRWW